MASRGVVVTADGQIYAGHHGTDNHFMLSGLTHEGNGLTYLMTPWTDGAQGSKFAIDAQLFSNALVTLTWFPPGGRDINNLGARLTGFSEVTPVPEPATYGMLAAGLGVVGAMARRRKLV